MFFLITSGVLITSLTLRGARCVLQREDVSLVFGPNEWCHALVGVSVLECWDVRLSPPPASLRSKLAVGGGILHLLGSPASCL